MNKAQLVSEFDGRVRALAAKHVRSRQDRDDLVQEGFLALFQASAAFDAEYQNHFWTFAYWRVEGAMQDYYRKRMSVSNSTDGAELDLESCETPEALLERAESASAEAVTLARVTAALETLPEAERAVVQQVVSESKTLRQLAEEARAAGKRGRNRRTITKRFTSALDALRKAVAA